MKTKNTLKNTVIISIAVILGLVVGVVATTSILAGHHAMGDDMENGMQDTMEDDRATFISLKSRIQEKMRGQHKYRCCLEKPCTYCIEKTPGHGEGAVCDCLKDIVDGVHPCGECIGEILEGHGNKYLAEYFARAISEEVGHEDVIKQIIQEKYGIPVDEQL